ncbi:hypothetical protein [Luteibacter yeojuensis]|uniref:Uncharacterized protein n=1 Tax=Luteibacter yeojuensis TaxID=345309 RepID=A0A0F3KYT4_9GAMM|nr:hypothetical protein [Luteibacter yeojuensis]KJV36445.1 hypothetical protein VI08_04810 [Luteibacter yeojuensis]
MKQGFRNVAMACLLGLAMPLFATSVGPIPAPPIPLGPWAFQMTPEQVKADATYGPYKSFSNGDLETYAGDFAGRKENVQFYFTDGKLARMMVSRYEGPDLSAAARVFGDTWRVLSDMYGPMELAYRRGQPAPAKVDVDFVARTAEAFAADHQKPQMAPLKQPVNAFVFVSLQANTIQGRVLYFVSVNYEPPHIAAAPPPGT